ncbi:hypothetical protein M3147_09175 [Agromyces mediolanus]|uniref:hypothetical protein n=1 Tax=Agromyces mediolanus TaxID=41986 RepID=UPI0020412169|nr:hypothetical protein [Agromyces mediolanus]MCM3657419.1 hypothetical protein [Agromyces mediolanus]
MSRNEDRMPEEEAGSYVESQIPGEEYVPEEGEGAYVDSELPEDAVVPDAERRVDTDDDELGNTQPIDHDTTGRDGPVPGTGPAERGEPMTESREGGLRGGDPGVEE